MKKIETLPEWAHGAVRIERRGVDEELVATWDTADIFAAWEEGWQLYCFGSYGGLGIRRVGTRFASDSEAEQFVETAAKLGSRLHQRAVRLFED